MVTHTSGNSNLAITRRTSTFGREDRCYPSRRETLEYYLEDLTSALESLSGTCPHDPMDPAFDEIFYSNGRYRYNEVLWADHVTVQDLLAAITEVKELIWQMDNGVEERATESETEMLPGQIMLLNVFCSPPVHMANCA